MLGPVTLEENQFVVMLVTVPLEKVIFAVMLVTIPLEENQFHGDACYCNP